MSDESFNKIDYRIRPAKSVERRLLAEAFAKLARIAPMREWTYIGFGSVYFTDFVLFHKSLGLEEMYSIEQANQYMDRVRFNKPYGYVGILPGTAAQNLPNIDWSKRSITWLDYDCPLDGEVLADLATVATNARPGSVFLATVDVDPKRVTAEWLSDLRAELGVGLVPSSLTPGQLKGSRGPAYAWKLMNRAVREAVRVRVQSSANASGLGYRQLFNFIYDDGSRMLTTGGILLTAADEADYVASGLPDLWFIRSASDPLELEIPKLTFKEMKALDRCMPWNSHSEPPPPALPAGAAEQYSKVYRQFPHFVEADF